MVEQAQNFKLSDHELRLLEYSFFSMCEEIDIFYCVNQNKVYMNELFPEK